MEIKLKDEIFTNEDKNLEYIDDKGNARKKIIISNDAIVEVILNQDLINKLNEFISKT